MSRGACDECLAWLGEALELVTRNAGDPSAVLAVVEGHGHSESKRNPLIGRITGTHLRNIGALKESIETLTQARDLARDEGDLDLAAEIGITLAGAYAMDGDTRIADEITSEIFDRRDDLIGLKARAQLGGLANFVGDVPRQMEMLDGLAEAFLSHDELEWAARCFSNYGFGLLQFGRARESLEPLQESRRLWLQLGSPEMASQPLNHLAVAYSVLAQPTEALNAIRLASSGRELTPDDLHGLIELYQQAGLVEDALKYAYADRNQSTTPRDRGLAESYLARLLLVIGRDEEAVESAESAVRLLTEGGVDDLAAEAAVLGVAARQRLNRTQPGDFDDLAGVPPETRTGRYAQIVKGDLLVSADELDAAEQQAEAIGTADVGLVGQLEANRLRARIFAARGDTQASLAKVGESLRSIGDMASSLASTDLSVATRSLGANLAEFGVGIALEAGDVGSLIGLIDELRLIDAPPEVRPSAEVSELLTSYRRLRRADAVDDLAHVEHELREAIRRSATGTRTRASAVPFDASSSVLGSRHLIMFFEHDDETYRISAHGEHVTVTRVGPTQQIDTLAAKIRMRLGSALASRAANGEPGQLIGPSGMVSRLDELLLEPVQSDEIVLIPPPSVFGVPWAMLPGLREASMVVNSSWSGWAHANRQAQIEDLACLFVAGPDLEAGAAEVDELADEDLADQKLVGGEATGEAVKAALPSRARAHLATHGVVRPDAPVLSQLSFADGPLTLYEMQASMPAELILSACSVGRERTYRGGLAVGFPAVALASGSRSVVAAEVDVPDGPTRRVMVRYHELRREGLEPALALRQTREDLSGSDPAAWLTAMAFNSYGA